MTLPRYERGLTRHPLGDLPKGMRGAERSVAVPEHAQTAVGALITSWEFKRRAGFETPGGEPVAGQEGRLGKTVLGMHFAEPIRVVWADEHGFGYETRPGHPLYGEESFVLENGRFTARSISRPSTLRWRLLTPVLRAMQRGVFRRYISSVESEIDRCRQVREPGVSDRPGNAK